MKDPFFYITLALSLLALVLGIVHIGGIDTEKREGIFVLVDEKPHFFYDGESRAVLAGGQIWVCEDKSGPRRMTNDPEKCLIEKWEF